MNVNQMSMMLIFRLSMALRGAVCLLVNAQRRAIISASRGHGTAAHARWGKCTDTVLFIGQFTTHHNFSVN